MFILLKSYDRAKYIAGYKQTDEYMPLSVTMLHYVIPGTPHVRVMRGSAALSFSSISALLGDSTKAF
jgi:hypothetical protein